MAPAAATPQALRLTTANFETHRCDEPAPGHYAIRHNMASRAFGLVFVLIGAVALAAGVYLWATAVEVAPDNTWILFLLGVVFLAAGAAMEYSSLLRHEISAASGIQSERRGWLTLNRRRPLAHSPLRTDQIVAVQLVAREVRSGNRRKRHYWQQQVNVLSADNTCHNLFVSLDRSKALAVAEKLSSALSAPLAVAD